MADHNVLGKKGETIAQNYLKNKYYLILDVNWKSRYSEIDIICKDQDVLVFVEVKTRTNIHFGAPHEFVNKNKQNLIAEASYNYMEKINYLGEVRYDVISIVLNNENIEIGHFIDAFFPGLE